MTYTGGDVIVEEIKVGDKHIETEWGMKINVEVISLPQLDGEQWTWQSKTEDGEIVDYLVTVGMSHYAPKLYKREK